MLAQAHEHTYRSRRRKHLRDRVLLHDLPRDTLIRIIDRPLTEQGRHPRAQRTVDDVAVPDDPTNIRGTPEHILRAYIKEGLQEVRRAHHVSAMHVHHALWFARRPGCIEDEQWIFTVHLFCWTLRRKLHEVVEIQFARTRRLELAAIPCKYNHLLHKVQPINSFVDDSLQRNILAAAKSFFTADDDPCFRVGNPIA